LMPITLSKCILAWVMQWRNWSRSTSC
jgi:hypothetical protein